jgi:tetratricopeptide (TPR) repeat protein
VRKTQDRPPVADDSAKQRAAGLPVGSNLAPLRIASIALALLVVAAAILVGAAAMQRPDDGTPRTATERALIDAKAAIDANPRDVDARLQLARAYIGMGQIETAVRTLQAAQELAPDDPRLAHLLGLAYLEGGDAASALTQLEQAAETEGAFSEDYAAMWFDIGRARLMNDDLEGAAAAFEKALVYSPQAADAIFELAGVYERLGRTEEAIAAYQGVLRFVPDHQGAQAGLSRLGSTDQ